MFVKVTMLEVLVNDLVGEVVDELLLTVELRVLAVIILDELDVFVRHEEEVV